MSPTGRAAVFFGAGRPIEVTEYPVPEPEPGALLVRLDYTSVCGSDVHYWKGEDPVVEQLASAGLVLGHETVGRVARLGAGVETDARGAPLRVGDPVVFAYFWPCGRCRACHFGRPHTCAQALHTLLRSPKDPPHFTGAFADYYHLRPGQYVLRLPEGMETSDAIGANCAVAQTTFALRRADLRPGERVVVQGSGGLGLYAIAAAKRMGAEMVVAIDASAERLAAARALGADRTVDVTEVIDRAERIERVKELTDGGGDLVLEVAGVRGVVSEGVRMVQRGGRYVEVGQIVHGGDRIEMPALALVTRNLSLLGVALYDPGVLDEVVDMLFELRGDPTLARLTGSRRYPLERLEEAFAGGDGAAGAARPVIDLRDGGAQ